MHKRWTRAFALLLTVGLSHAQGSSTAPLHPATYVHAGWAQTTGGKGGKVIRVTTLAADGPGSLKAALDTPGPRIVVFEVGGVIVGDAPTFRADQMPYGGIKASGVGREGLRFAMNDYTHERVLVLTGLDL